jgi:dipeptidyl aminopeptidase/acylaminoacyl peptidase
MGIRLLLVCLTIAVLYTPQSAISGDFGSARQAPTVRDSIQMMAFGADSDSAARAIQLSPDRRNLLVLTRAGDVRRNTNDYYLFNFSTADIAARHPQASLLLKWSSSTNIPAISSVQWLSNSRSALFLGTQYGAHQQIYLLNLGLKKVTRLTASTADIVAYDATPDLETIAYLVQPPPVSLLNQESRASGVLIKDQWLTDLLVGQSSGSYWATPLQLYIARRGRPAKRIPFPLPETPIPSVWLSPSGKFVIIRSNTLRYASPVEWRQYKTQFGNQVDDFLVYRVVETSTGHVSPLIDAPAFCDDCIVWLPIGEHVVVGGTYLPLDVADKSERERRKTDQWAVEVDVVKKSVTRIAQGRYSVFEYDAQTDMLALRPERSHSFSEANRVEPGLVTYQRDAREEWRKVSGDLGELHRLRVWVQQDMNTSPQLYATVGPGSQPLLVFDPNPQFRNIEFSKVEEIAWHSTDGQEYRGGLYLPASRRAAEKHPLVIQTHGWSRDEFAIDGYSTAGFAAQALAGSGFVVAQAPMAAAFGDRREGRQNMLMFEGLIEELDRRGLIDRKRIGLLGFSRTGFAARYALAFSKEPIAAAVIADGMEGGYWQYIFEMNEAEEMPQTFEAQEDAMPFGQGLKTWLSNAPTFNLDRVRTPLRLLGFGRYSFEYNWETFVGLRRLGKPIDYIWLPDALHEPVKPSERLTAQQGDVDWFRFWLQGCEDPAPTKKGQYIRWRKLRASQEAQDAPSAVSPATLGSPRCGGL